MKDQSQRSPFHERPLKSLCQMNLKSLGENTDPDTQIRYIDIGGVSYQEGVTSRETLTFSSAPSRARRCVQKNDIIISTVRTYLRAVAMIDEIDDGAIASTGFAVCRANETTDSKFLYYAMMAEPFINQVIIKSTGISYPAINSSTLGGIKLPVPNHRKQQAISGFLDRETRRIDDLIAEKGSFITLLREKRVAEISCAVTKGINPDAPMQPSGQDWLGNAPAHWDTFAAARLFDERDERSPTGGEELLTVSHLTGVTPRSEKTVHMIEAESTVGYKRCHSGDLVVNTLWAWMGAMGTAPMLGIVSPAYNIYTPRAGLMDARYIDYIVRLPIFAKEVTRFSKGVWSSRLRLYPQGFREVRWPVPPAAEQASIADYLDRETTRIDGLITETKHSIALLKEKRAALITAAVTGKIDVRNAA